MDPYLAEIRLVSFNFAPKGWAFCNGQLLPISQNQGLYSLLGTTYGGDGHVTFALPNLRGRLPIHRSDSLPQGQVVGTESVRLIKAEIPPHNHYISVATTAASKSSPSGAYPAVPTVSVGKPYYLAANANMDPNMIGSTGGGQPHSNMMPYLVLNYVIALVGIYPSRN